MKTISKPWGKEVWFAHNELYACKIIYLKKGTRTSLQYHNQKHETIYIDRGKARLFRQTRDGNAETRILNPGDVVENQPHDIHRLEALEDVRLIEASTPQLNDVIRVDDDFSR